jgi:hypothetical protein
MNEIVPISQSQRELTPQIWQMISQMAPVMYNSRLFGVVSKDAAAAIMLKGYELGLSVTASFEFINVISGKPGLSPRGALALLQTHPDIEKIEINQLTDDKGGYVGHACTIRRKNGFEYTAHYTLEDARRAGLIKPDSGWSKYPQNMCMWRAVGFAADVAAPDITAGMTTIIKMPEELGVTIDGSGEIVDVQAAPVAPDKPVVTLETLLTQYAPDAIMAANGGKIPATQDEIEMAAAALTAAQS